MKIAISNIAWNHHEDTKILKLLKKYAISGVEIAPTKIWENPTSEPANAIRQYRQFWENEGITIPSTQSILFGHPELNIFESPVKRRKTLFYIEKMIRVSSLLGARVMVFGSPKNRDRKNISNNEALDIASEFFYKIGEIAKPYNIFFCIEPNPKAYGTNFINNTDEAIILLNRVNHQYFKLHLDSGVLTLNGEIYKDSITKGFPYLKHFHISEKNLLPIGQTALDHKKIAQILKNLHFDRWVSIEMRGIDNKANSKVVEEVLKFVSTIYVS